MHTQTCKHDLFKRKFDMKTTNASAHTIAKNQRPKIKPGQTTHARKTQYVETPNPKVPKNKTAPQRQHHKPMHVKDKPPDLERRPTRLRENEAHHREPVFPR